MESLWKFQNKGECMIGIIKAIFSKLQKEYKDEWLACSALGENYLKKQGLSRGIFKYFDENRRYINYQVGDLVPFIENGVVVAKYKVINWKREGGDLAGWDDGRKYHLKLHSIV